MLATAAGASGAAHAQSTSDVVAACDRAAASPYEKSRPAGIAGVEPNKVDPDIAVPACEAAAVKETADARIIMQLGRAYIAAKNDDAARMQFDRANRMGNTLAANALGAFYAEGRGGFPQDQAEAVRLYRIAADQGLSVAQSNLAFFYQDGRGGLTKDLVEAAHYHKTGRRPGLPRLAEHARLLLPERTWRSAERR